MIILSSFVNAESDAYGGGSTTLGLVATSIHPQRAGVQIPLMQILLDYGARMDQPSAGGNGQSIINGCLANGQPEAAEFFANRGAPVVLQRDSPADVRDEGFHATPLDLALYLWANSPDVAERERCYEVVALLARAGAKPDAAWYEEDEARRRVVEKMRADSRMLAALRGKMLR
jgi:hypothetical protein